MMWLDRALVVMPHYFGLCLCEKAFKRQLGKLGIPKADWPQFIGDGADASTHHFKKSDGKLCIIVTLGNRKGKTQQQTHAMLVHEAVHIWQDVRRVLGENNPSSEFEAYSVQAISQRLMEAYEELSGKERKAKKK